MGNIKAAAAYFFGILGGIIVYFIAKEDQFAKFSAVQSILFVIAFTVVYIAAMVLATVISIGLLFLGDIGMMLAGIVGLIGFVLPGLLGTLAWIYLVYTGFTGKKVSLPVIGGFAEKFSM